VFQIPSVRTVSQTPSTPWGRENAISAARLGSPELQRLPEATTYGFSAHAHRAAAAAIRIHRALASCAPSAGLRPGWTVHDSRIRFLLGTVVHGSPLATATETDPVRVPQSSDKIRGDHRRQRDGKLAMATGCCPDE